MDDIRTMIGKTDRRANDLISKLNKLAKVQESLGKANRGLTETNTSLQKVAGTAAAALAEFKTTARELSGATELIRGAEPGAITSAIETIDAAVTRALGDLTKATKSCQASVQQTKDLIDEAAARFSEPAQRLAEAASAVREAVPRTVNGSLNQIESKVEDAITVLADHAAALNSATQTMQTTVSQELQAAGANMVATTTPLIDELRAQTRYLVDATKAMVGGTPDAVNHAVANLNTRMGGVEERVDAMHDTIKVIADVQGDIANRQKWPWQRELQHSRKRTAPSPGNRRF